ncbi:MCE family protein [Nocardia terpenica]|uniref:Mammalian cell entry protein n=1 Tax=Nocardia terpenica TaxID=455432 RepID=A0A164JTJ9_9NOCA|nr:MCE family protein [Nocardia terpenica]ATL70884.1 mammalian cell entry protein [Nocardia terpenica]KZM70710.1 mammalian cell entry protein [Nocardia terpenica]MBF6060212.1 MCE family protein [Nocardia terpenica]MBF6103472.1 MCE family protein [Nocardia terpenica]MBF6112154.1 MCE family protein [Nocardia terpenica]
MSASGVQFWRSTETLRKRTLGVLFFVVMALFLSTTVMIYNKVFTKVVRVDLITDTVGNALTRDADVKVRGVTVGEVRSSESAGGKVTLHLALDPEKAGEIPSNVTARLLPKTLFGERYVDLVWPQQPSAQRLRAGMTLQQDASGNAVEVSQLLDSVMPLLQAIPPQYLASTLGALSQALGGQGAELGHTIDRLDTIFRDLNGVMPVLQDDIRSFAQVADLYSDALPQLVDTFDNLRTTNATIVQKRSQLDTLYSVLTPTSSHTADFLLANHDNIIDVAADSREALTLLATYSPSYACAMRNFAQIKPRIDRIFGKGTDTPGSRVTVQIVNTRGRYLPNQDEPRWLDTRGPVCFPEPPLGVDAGQYPAKPFDDGSYPVPSRNPGDQNAGQLPPAQFSVYGKNTPTLAGSPAEQNAVGAVIGAAHGVNPEQVPGWISRIAAPSLRGSEVSVR